MTEEAQTETTETQTTETQETSEMQFDLDAFLASNPAAKKAYDAKTAGQQSALVKERELKKAKEKEAAEYSDQLRELAKTADAETAAKLKTQADENDAKLEEARQEAAFLLEAAQAGVPADRLSRAWTLCKNAGYIDKRGNPDIAAMKAEIPELFAAPQTTTRTDAGTGTRQRAAVAQDFNSNLRGVLRPQ
jgi:hypothetical protein